MTDPFKGAESTAYASQQNFVFIPNYLKGQSVARAANVSDLVQSGGSSSLGVKGQESVNKNGFSSGKSLKQSQLFPVSSSVPPQPARRPAQKKAPRSFPINNSDYHYNKNT